MPRYSDNKINMTNALIVDENFHVLLVHNCKNGNNRYEFCGGKLEDGETLLECVERENREELGIEIVVSRVVGDYKTQTPEGNFICRTYQAGIIQGAPKIIEPENMDWVDYVGYQRLEELAEQGTLVPNLVAMLPKLKKILD